MVLEKAVDLLCPQKLSSEPFPSDHVAAAAVCSLAMPEPRMLQLVWVPEWVLHRPSWCTLCPSVERAASQRQLEKASAVQVESVVASHFVIWSKVRKHRSGHPGIGIALDHGPVAAGKGGVHWAIPAAVQ